MNHSTLCIGADVHLDEIVLCAVDKADGHEVTDPFRVTNRLAACRVRKLRQRPLLRQLHVWAAPRRDRLGSDGHAVDPFPPLPEQLLPTPAL